MAKAQIRFKIERFDIHRGFVKVASGIGTLKDAEKAKARLARELGENIENLSIVITVN